MGFFNRNKNKNVKEPKTSIPKIEYYDLRSSLTNALSIGSKDAKFLDITTEDNGQFILFTKSGNIKYAYSKNDPLRFSERLFWVQESEMSIEKRESLSGLVNDFSNINFYATILKEFPEAKNTVDKILKDYTLSVMLKLNNSKINKIYTELMFKPESTIIENTDFFDETVDNLIEKVEIIEKDEIKFLNTLNKDKNEDVSLQLAPNTSFVPKNDIETLIYSAAEANSTVKEVREASTGFLFSEVLETLNSLIYGKKILIDEINEDDEESLPEIPLDNPLSEVETKTEEKSKFDKNEEKSSTEVENDDTTLQNNEKELIVIPVVTEKDENNIPDQIYESESQNESSPADKMASESGTHSTTTFVSPEKDDLKTDNSEDEETLDNTEKTPVKEEFAKDKEIVKHNHSHSSFEDIDDDDFIYSYPPEEALEGISEDDGGFDFEDLDDSIEEGMTGGLDDPDFDKDFEKVMTKENLSTQEFNKLKTLVKKNRKLEKSVVEVEQDIAKHQSEYNNSIADYQDISLDRGVQNILNDTVEEDPELETTRDESNNVFFNLHTSELNRFDLNQERKVILEQLFNSVDSFSSEYVQEMLHRISLKLDGIESVMNSAFHDPKEDNDMPVDEELVNDLKNSESEVEIHEEETLVNNEEDQEVSRPMFDQIVEELGFNPFKDISNKE